MMIRSSRNSRPTSAVQSNRPQLKTNNYPLRGDHCSILTASSFGHYERGTPDSRISSTSLQPPNTQRSGKGSHSLASFTETAREAMKRLLKFASEGSSSLPERSRRKLKSRRDRKVKEC